MSPDYTLLLTTGVAFSLLVLAFLGWRFGRINVAVFVIVAGLFPAAMDFLSSFVVENYVYPGQTRTWVFTYIFFGWMAVCGTCLLLAEGIVARRGEDVLSGGRLTWQVPVATAVIAVLLDLFIDPIAVTAGYWQWQVPANVYYGIPLLNFTGWFVLMLLASLAWILIARRSAWGARAKLLAALLGLVPLSVTAIVLSLAMNGLIAAAGLQ